MGIAFTVTQPTHVTSIEGTFGIGAEFSAATGGWIYTPGTNGNIWGGISPLNSSGVPIMDFSSTTSGVVASTVFNVPIVVNGFTNDPVDLVIPLSVDLAPGDYGLVFSEGGAFAGGLPNATSRLLMASVFPPTSGYGGFSYNGNWNRPLGSGPFVNNLVFGVQGTPVAVPEPTAAGLALVAGLAGVSRRRR
jgi:hypothetical protein